MRYNLNILKKNWFISYLYIVLRRYTSPGSDKQEIETAGWLTLSVYNILQSERDSLRKEDSEMNNPIMHSETKIDRY